MISNLITILFVFICLIPSWSYGEVNYHALTTKDIHESQKSIINYWTPERLAHAKELTPSNRSKKMTFKRSAYQKTDIPIFFQNPQRPTIKLIPESRQLFTPIKRIKASLDKGTSEQFFTSSQLVPVSADLYYPYTTVGRLFFTIPGEGDFSCSAAAINQRVILTAAHCVHDGINGDTGFFINFTYIPSFRDGTAPFRSWAASFVVADPTWTLSDGLLPNAADYAVLEIFDQEVNGIPTRLGEVTGFLGFQTQSLSFNHVHMLGYPCNFDSCTKMHQVAANNGPLIDPNNVAYGSDMLGGSDGGPWVQNFGIKSIGQEDGLNPNMRIVGVGSTIFLDTTQKIQTSSILDQRLVNMFSLICSHQSRNCGS